MPTLKQKEIIFQKIGYNPSEHQAKIHFSDSRIKLVAGGERSGKSKCSSAEYTSKFWETPLLWLVAADYERTKAEYIYICEHFDKLGVPYRASKNIDPGEIEVIDPKTNSVCWRIDTKSAKDPRKLAMQAPDGVIVCEASQVDYETYLRLRGRIAEKRGWMLLSGCLSGDMLVPTERGLMSIKELVGGGTHTVSTNIVGLNGKEESTLAFYNGEKPTTRVTLSKGFAIEGTNDHKVIVQKPDRDITWVSLKNLSNKDLVAIRYSTNIYGTFHYDQEESYLAGLYIAEGSWEGRYKQAPRNGHNTNRRSAGRLTFTLGGDDPVELLTKRGFVDTNKTGHWRKADKRLSRFFAHIGIDPRWTSHTKEVPPKILKANRKTQVAFLQGLFDGDGSATKRAVSFRTVSQKLAQQIQQMLLNIGVVACKTEGYYKSTYDGKPRFISDLTIYDSERFASLIGFRISRKQDIAKNKKAPRFLRNQAKAGKELLGYPVCWCKVLSKEEGFCETFDLHVPGSHAYCANGLIVHNTFESSLGWYPNLFTRWQAPNKEEAVSFSLPTWTNLAVYPGGRQDPEILALEMSDSPERFKERYGGIPCPPQGTVFNEFQPSIHVGQGGEFEFDPAFPTYTWVDPGYAHPYAVEVAQKKGDTIYIVDEIYEKGLVTSDIITVVAQRQWFPAVQKTGGAIDIAARQHQSMPAPAEIWLKEGHIYLRSQKIRIQDGIERFKSVLKVNPLTNRPAFYVNSKCKGLISELGGCPNPFDGQTKVYRWRRDREGNIIGDVPDDKNNDGCKAVCYGLIDVLGYTPSTARRQAQFF